MNNYTHPSTSGLGTHLDLSPSEFETTVEIVNSQHSETRSTNWRETKRPRKRFTSIFVDRVSTVKTHDTTNYVRRRFSIPSRHKQILLISLVVGGNFMGRLLFLLY